MRQKIYARSVRLLSFLLVCGALSCASKGTWRDNVFESSKLKYTIGQPDANWEPVSFKGADAAWLSKRDDASLLISSGCEKKQDIPLAGLTGQLLIGLTDQNTIEQKTLQNSGRDALETQISAKIDGVPRRMMIFVMKKNDCVFDIVFASSPENFEENVATYFAVRDAFEAETK